MTAGSLLLGAALLLIVLLVIVRPFFDRAPATEAPLSPRESLLVQKEALLDEIRALDFDLETGKLPPEVHAPERARRVANAAALLAQIDALPGPDAAIVAAIEVAVAQRRRPQPAATAGFCPQCGQAARAGDRFCPYCGASLTTADLPA